MARSDQTIEAGELQELLLHSPGFPEFLLGLATISASLLNPESPAHCAVTVERADGPATVASSTPTAQRLDEQQYAFDDGPCLTALREQHTVMIPDLAVDPRWHRYAEAVSGESIRSVLAVPITTDSSSGAAINAYSTEVGAFDPPTIASMEQLASSLSTILRLALRVHPPEQYPEELRTVLQSRAVVDAAVALVMAQTRCSHQRAISILHVAARHHNKRVHEVAEELLKAQGQVPWADEGVPGQERRGN